VKSSEGSSGERGEGEKARQFHQEFCYQQKIAFSFSSDLAFQFWQKS
jgi:hypothetical protein